MISVMNDNKLKHLEFIQNVIVRMGTNSFIVKGWAITLVSAIYALAAKDANLHYVMITYIVVPAFWLLDGFFLSVERQYSSLYNEVIKKDEKDIDFSMDISRFNSDRNTWPRAIVSKTFVLFYGALFLVVHLVMLLFPWLRS